MKHAYGNAFWSWAYQQLLDRYERLLPKRFLKPDTIPKTGAAFNLYLHLVEGYVTLLRKIEGRDRTFSRLLQERRMRSVLRAAAKTPWWRSYFAKHGVRTGAIRTLSDFRQIRPITRTDLLDAAKEDLLTRDAAHPSIVWRRSGGSTTGTPFVWGLNKTLLYINVLSHFIKELEGRGFPYAKSAHTPFYIDFNWPHGFVRSEFRWFSGGDFSISTSDPGAPEKMRKMAEHMAAIGGVVVRTSPSELPFLVQECRDQDLHPPILFFSVTGGPLEEDVRVLAADYFGAQVMAHYGSQEMGPLSIECTERHGSYHVFSERVVVEILDEAGRPVTHGTPGQITVTCLDNTVMPLIRYQPGDIGILRDAQCLCVNRAPLLEIQSRDTDVITLIDGSGASARSILRRFSAEPFVSRVRRFQVRQDIPGTVRILLEIKTPIEARVLETLAMRIRARYANAVDVSIEQLPAIMQDGPKFKVFVPLKKNVSVMT